MDFAFDARTEELRKELLEFMDEFVYPAEPPMPRMRRRATGGHRH
jgi:acyl-CoA dehydrogenase